MWINALHDSLCYELCLTMGEDICGLKKISQIFYRDIIFTDYTWVEKQQSIDYVLQLITLCEWETISYFFMQKDIKISPLFLWLSSNCYL